MENKVTPIYGYSLKFMNRLDLMTKAVEIFVTLESMRKKEKKLRSKLVEVLAFYVLNGYGKKTKKMIIETLKISADNLCQINSELTKKNLLIRDRNNLRKKYLHPDLKKLREVFTDSDNLSCKRAIAIRFDG